MPVGVFCGTRIAQKRGALVMATLILLATPTAAQSLVEGEVVASSLQFPDPVGVQADAYLLGVRRDASDDSAYKWSFEADHATVSMTSKHYVTLQETSNKTVETTHHNASGVLLKRYPLAYIMATSNRPDDQEATFRLVLDLPPETLEPRSSIDFESTTRGGLPEPVFGDVFDGDDPASDQPQVSYQRPWPHLARELVDFREALVLEGNFTLHLYDAFFEVQGDLGTATYNATYGGWRGIETGTNQNLPPAEHNVTTAQIRFTNATLTFYPAGRPIELNVRSAGLDLEGSLVLEDVRGQLQDAAGVHRQLDGNLVELQSMGMHLNARPLGSDQEPPDVYLAFNGSLRGATVDGRSLELAPATQDATEPPDPGVDAGVAGAASDPLAWDINWWLVLLVALAAAAAALATAGRWVVASQRARRDPDSVVEQGEAALDRGHYHRARSFAGRVLRHHPDHHDAVALHAMTHINRKETGKALAFLQPYVLGPADDGGLLSLVYCMALRKERGVEEARAFFRKAVKVHPAIVEVAGEYAGVARDFLGEDGVADDASYS